MLLTATILGGLGLFLYGMKVMSESLQNATGEGLKNVLWKVTNNRVKGVLTGFGITSIIQSSSATTVMLVSFVSAGLINLEQSIGIILGANIGTTVTGWIVAIIGFKFKITTLALPSIAIGFFLRFMNREKVTYWGEVLLGFGMLFLGLSFMSDSVKDLRGSESIMNFMATYKADDLFSTFMAIMVGTVITMIVQSSSATMAMTMTLAVNGLIDFPTSCALILGENIGTTITAYIASIGSSISAKRAARVHMLFNVLGVTWMIFLFKPVIIPFIDWIVPGDPFSIDQLVRERVIADHMAAFHTTFNIANTLLFLPFTGFLAAIATRLVPSKKGKPEEEEFHLKFISTSLLSTPAMNLNQARLETKRMMDIVTQMFKMVMDIFDNPTTKLGPNVEKIETLENHTDLLEKEISTFLVRISQGTISQEQSHEISCMLQRVNELERIGDHCVSLLRLLRRKYENKIDFTESATRQVHEISGKVMEFLSLISQHFNSSANIMTKANVIENRINELRREMRQDHVQRLSENLCDVDSGLIFIDMLTSFEKIGDHSYNIAEGISGLRYF